VRLQLTPDHYLINPDYARFVPILLKNSGGRKSKRNDTHESSMLWVFAT
jgi:hypothetical protein